MATDPKQFRTELNAEINQGLSKFNQRFIEELRATTPIRTGFARSQWVNTHTTGVYGRTSLIPLARNTAPYIGVLDKQRTSMQAPEGIVEPALRKATRK
jgi:hypothetical protein